MQNNTFLYCYKYYLLCIPALFISVFLYNCSVPDSNKESGTGYNQRPLDSLENLLNPYIGNLHITPEKKGFLSEKEAAVIAFKYAIEHGYIENVKNEFPDSYQDLRMGDMFLVEDSVNGDYYFTAIEHKNGTLAIILQVDAKSGDILSCGAYHPEQKVALSKQEEIKINMSRHFQKEVSSVKPVFIYTADCYSPLYHWQYAVTFKEGIATRSGNRSLAVIQPFYAVSPFQQMQSRNTSGAFPEKNKVMFLKNQNDEEKIFSNSDSEYVFELEEINE